MIAIQSSGSAAWWEPVPCSTVWCRDAVPATDAGYMSRKIESLERINSRRETNENFDQRNSCKRLGTSCLHELHESKFSFVSRIEFIDASILSNCSAHVSGATHAPSHWPAPAGLAPRHTRRDDVSGDVGGAWAAASHRRRVQSHLNLTCEPTRPARLGVFDRKAPTRSRLAPPSRLNGSPRVRSEVPCWFCDEFRSTALCEAVQKRPFNACRNPFSFRPGETPQWGLMPQISGAIILQLTEL